MPIYALDSFLPQIHRGAYINPDEVIIGNVRIGAQSSVWPSAVLRADFGQIVIGERTSIQDGTVVHTTEEEPTVIGDDCVLGHNSHLEGCTREDGCLGLWFCCPHPCRSAGRLRRRREGLGAPGPRGAG